MADLECHNCTDWKGCPGKDWYPYGDIIPCAQQVFWLLKWEYTLSDGVWPLPDERADVGVRGRHQITEGPFVKAVVMVAEMRERLASTGWRGRLLAEQCKNRPKMDYIDSDLKPVLYYVSGPDRRDTPFRVWRAMRFNKMLKNQAVSVSQ